MISSVLLLCKAYPPVAGGVETFSEQVARAYARRGIDVTVLTQTEGPGGWETRMSSDSTVRVFNVGRGNQLQVALRLRRELRRLMRATKFDLIHATTWRPALVVPKKRRPPVAISVHGREVLATSPMIRRLAEVVLNHADHVFVVSTATQSRVIAADNRFDARRWIVAGNGISFPRDAAEFQRGAVEPGRPLRILTVARLIPRKNIAKSIEALQGIHADGAFDFVYRVIGGGPLLEELRARVAAHRSSNAINIEGYRDEEDLLAAYRWADVFLHPQVDTEEGVDFEGFGLSIADAMSFGNAAIAGSGAGPDDFIRNGETGILVDGEDLAAIRAALNRLALDADFRNRLAHHGRAYVLSSLSWDKHVETVLLAIEQPSRALSDRKVA